MDLTIVMIIGELTIAVLVLLLINVLTRGWLATFFIVKISGGAKIFMRISDVGDTYHTIGKITDGMIKYKNKEKKDAVLSVKENQIYRSINLSWIDVTEDGKIIPRYSAIVSGHDPVKNQNMIVRGLKAPEIKSRKEQVKAALIVAISLGIIIATAIMCYNILNRADMIYNNQIEIIDLIKSLSSKGVIS